MQLADTVFIEHVCHEFPVIRERHIIHIPGRVSCEDGGLLAREVEITEVYEFSSLVRREVDPFAVPLAECAPVSDLLLRRSHRCQLL
jgi:hypothetical protein